MHFLIPFILGFGLTMTAIQHFTGYPLQWFQKHSQYKDCYIAIDAKQNFNRITEDLLESCEVNPVPENKDCENLVIWISDFQRSGITDIYNQCLLDMKFVDSLPLKTEFKIIDIKVADHDILNRINILFDIPN